MYALQGLNVRSYDSTLPRHKRTFCFRKDVLGSQRNYRGIVWVEILVILDILLISILENRLLKSRRLALCSLYRPPSDCPSVQVVCRSFDVRVILTEVHFHTSSEQNRK